MPPPYQAHAAEQADSQHPSHDFHANDSQHAPGYDRDTPGQGAGSERYSPPSSSEYRATSPSFSFRGSENGSESSSAFSPQYEVTSPSYSPQRSQDGPSGKAAAVDEPTTFAAAAHQASLHASFNAKPHGHATESAFAGQGSSDVPVQTSRLLAIAVASPHQADIARPSTARGRNSTQQHVERSAFCFARPPRTQTAPETLTHAASAEDGALGRAQVSSSYKAPAEEANQRFAADSGTPPERTHPDAFAHCRAAAPADAVLSEVASRLQQAAAVQARVVPTEAVHAQAAPTEAVQAASPQTEAVQSASPQTEGMQTQAVQAESFQADGVPSPFAPQAPGSNARAKPTFVWASLKPLPATDVTATSLPPAHPPQTLAVSKLEAAHPTSQAVALEGHQASTGPPEASSQEVFEVSLRILPRMT